MTNKVARLALEKLHKGSEENDDTMDKQPLRKIKKEPHYLMERNTQPRESYLNKVIELMDLDEKELFNKMTSKDKYKEGTATYRLQCFRKLQNKIEIEKKKYIEDARKTGRPLPKRGPLGAPKLQGARPFSMLHKSTKPQVYAGEDMNETQRRLVNPQSFPIVYKQKLIPQFRDDRPQHGDICDDPIKSRTLLMNRTYQELNIPGRPLDFTNEVSWRVKLRPAEKPSELPNINTFISKRKDGLFEGELLQQPKKGVVNIWDVKEEEDGSKQLPAHGYKLLEGLVHDRDGEVVLDNELTKVIGSPKRAAKVH